MIIRTIKRQIYAAILSCHEMIQRFYRQLCAQRAKGFERSFLMDVSHGVVFQRCLRIYNKAERILCKGLTKRDRKHKKTKKQKYKTHQHLNTAEYFITRASLLLNNKHFNLTGRDYCLPLLYFPAFSCVTRHQLSYLS